MATKPSKKRKPNKQHGVKGAAFIRFGDKLRDLAVNTTGSGQFQLLTKIADAAIETGEEVRKLR